MNFGEKINCNICECSNIFNDSIKWESRLFTVFVTKVFSFVNLIIWLQKDGDESAELWLDEIQASISKSNQDAVEGLESRLLK